MTTCAISDCGRRTAARGWCWKHYLRWYRHGDPVNLPDWKRDLAERFWEKVDFEGEGGCWLWTSALDTGGYGAFHRDGKQAAHRVAYELKVGQPPKGLQAHHLCGVRACVNPEHLAWLLPSVHGALHSLKRVRCPQGHAYTPENTYVSPTTGVRSCLLCRQVRNAARYR